MKREAFHRVEFHGREPWLEERKKYIQASDAAAILDVSPWKNITQLYDEKTGLVEAPDISNRPYVIYGKMMEPSIRDQFLIDFPFFECEYHEFDILVNNARPWQGCTLDGELIVVKDNPWNFPIGSKGILECKTGSWTKWPELDKWIKFPIQYHAQQVHQLAVTGWLFNFSASRLRREAFKDEDNGFPEIRTLYHLITRIDACEDILYLNEKETIFKFRNLERGIRPPHRLKNIQ